MDDQARKRWKRLAEAIRLWRPNLLITGTTPAADAMVRWLCPYLELPVETRVLPGPLDLPTHESGTLILRDVGLLEKAQQAELFRWLEDAHQLVVSVTSRALFELTRCGAFNEDLYYRLNILLEDADQWVVAGAPG
jgi:hypothetical protein